MGSKVPFWVVLRDAKGGQKYRCHSENPAFDGATIRIMDVFGDNNGFHISWDQPPKDSWYVSGGAVRMVGQITRSTWELI